VFWVAKSIEKLCLIKTNEVLSRTVKEGWNFNSGNYLFTTDTK